MKPVLQCHILPVLQDNYVYLIHDPASQQTAAVDPSVAGPVLETLHEKGWMLTHIFSTHHHGDHVGGNRALKSVTQCEIIGFAGDAHRIPGIERKMEDEEEFAWGGDVVRILFIPGHTLGHIAYYFVRSGWVFCGDTLFSLGCGRLFEGTASQMHHSLQKLAALPNETLLYCGHEYTEANARFALTVEPTNLALRERANDVRGLRAYQHPTLPSAIGMEKATNPFLRTHSPEIRAELGMENASDEEVFAELRKRKDGF